VRFNTSQIIQNIKINEASTNDWLYLNTAYPTYAVKYSESKEKADINNSSLVNTAAPKFSYTSFSGKKVGTQGQKLLLLDFWETWCGYCILAMPRVKELYQKYHEKGLDIIGVVSENKAPVEKILKSQNTAYETIFVDKEMLDKYKVDARPRYILINEQGMIVGDFDGSFDEVEKIISKLLD
jgi:thiol-disulfide isomerase/thioredoxin